ncbi:MAG: DUF2569 domain-containing protein [Erysipelothrix sp.]|nr:DUF2569 domain-containing protein [Erysipelothrix sp.]
MDSNLLVILLTVGLIFMTLFNRFKMFMEHKKALDNINHRGDFKKMYTGWKTVILYVITLLAASGWLIMLLLSRDNYTENEFIIWILVLAVFIVTAATDIVKSSVIHTTYYNDQGIFHNTDYFRYSSVKNFRVKRLGLATEVILYNGETYAVPTKALQALEDRIVKVQKEAKKK